MFRSTIRSCGPSSRRGFTLIEILLVIAIIAILAAVVIIAVNPGKQMGEARNSQRRSDVRTILDAVYQYSLDNAGALPSELIPVGTSCDGDGEEICSTGISCDGINLDELADEQTYLVELPRDPGATDPDFTGYKIYQLASGRVTVCAPLTYGDDQISVTR